MFKRMIIGLAGLVVLCVSVLYGAGRGCFSADEGPGELTTEPIPEIVIASRQEAQRAAASAQGVPAGEQILFGDLHVHTTVSMDAFLMSLPLVQGEGSRPQADA
jgi:hypothetical protein